MFLKVRTDCTNAANKQNKQGQTEQIEQTKICYVCCCVCSVCAVCSVCPCLSNSHTQNSLCYGIHWEQTEQTFASICSEIQHRGLYSLATNRSKRNKQTERAQTFVAVGTCKRNTQTLTNAPNIIHTMLDFRANARKCLFCLFAVNTIT